MAGRSRGQMSRARFRAASSARWFVWRAPVRGSETFLVGQQELASLELEGRDDEVVGLPWILGPEEDAYARYGALLAVATTGAIGVDDYRFTGGCVRAWHDLCGIPFALGFVPQLARLGIEYYRWVEPIFSVRRHGTKSSRNFFVVLGHRSTYALPFFESWLGRFC